MHPKKNGGASEKSKSDALILTDATPKAQALQPEPGKSILPEVQWLIAQGRIRSALALIESKLGYSGDVARLVLALAQQLSTPLPSLPNEGGEQ